MKSLGMILAVVGFAFSVQAREIPGMRLYAQEQTQWCWAAVTQTIAQQVGAGYISQCRMASRFVYGVAGDTCCSPGYAASSSCNQGNKIWGPMAEYRILQGNLPYALAQNQIINEIEAGRPMAARIEWNSNTAHYLVIYGATDATLSLWDPANGGDRYVLARNQVVAYHGGYWERTLTSRRP